jgi:hypothetical protein
MNTKKIITAGATGLVVATIANVITFFAGKAAGIFPETVIIPNAGQPLTVVPVVISSLITAIGATGLFLLLSKFLAAKAVTVFRIIAVLFLFVSFAGPYSIPDVPSTMAIGLNLMHVWSGIALIYFLTVKGKE